MIKIDAYVFLNRYVNLTMTETATNSSSCVTGDTMALDYMKPYLERLKKKSSLYIELFKKHFCEDFASSYAYAMKTIANEPPSSYEDLWLYFAKSAYNSALYYAEREEEHAEAKAKAMLELPAELLTSMKKDVWIHRDAYKIAKTAQDQAYRHFRDASSCFHMYNHAPTKETYCEEYTDSMKEADNKIAHIMIGLLPFEIWHKNKTLLETYPRAILKYEYDVF
jgi:hypothetical protein